MSARPDVAQGAGSRLEDSAKRPAVAEARSLDHVIVSVQDLQRAEQAWRRLGFAVMPRAVHDKLGTANHIIQFHDNYFELLGDYHRYSSAAMREFMASRFEGGDGLAMLSLSCRDLPADRARLAEAGLAPGEILNSSRRVRLADGRDDATASASMIVWRAAPRRWSTLFYSHHGKPETIWFAPWQDHPNTVWRMAGITYASDDLEGDGAYFRQMLCAPPSAAGPQRLAWRTPRGEAVELLSPAAMAGRHAVPVPASPFPVWPVSLRFEVQSLSRCQATLREAGVPFIEADGTITVAADQAHGVICEFVERGPAGPA